MNKSIQQCLIVFLEFHRPVFSEDMMELGCVPDFQHNIKLKPDAKVVCQWSYKTTQEDEAEIQKQVQMLLDLGIMTYCDSIWSSGMILVETKTEKPGDKLSLGCVCT